jgi:multiple sugar transport system permease protein
LNGAAMPYLMAAPAALYLLVFVIYPLVEDVRISFTDASLLAPRGGTAVGVANYLEVLGSTQFWASLQLTLLYAAVSVTLALCLGLAAALLLNRPFHGRGLVRAALSVPWATPSVAVALTFAWMFNDQYGIVNFGLTRLGLLHEYTQWFDSPQLALPALIAVTVWMTFPFAALVLTAALQFVPKELYEAAMIDGASTWSLYRYVVMPLIRPTVAVVALFLSIWALRRFDIIWLLTQGGPVGATNTLVVNLYQDAFVETRLGLGAAVGTLGVALSVIATAVYYVAIRRTDRVGAR